MDFDWQKIWDSVRGWDGWAGVIAGIATLVVGWFLAKLARRILRAVMKRAKVDPTLISFSTNMAYMALLAFVVVAALEKFGVATGSFVAIVGAAGLAVGFALQGSLSNFAAGVMIIMFRPFKIGDYVEAGGTSGTVEEIMIFSTVMKTPDNKRVIAPNSEVMGGVITNYSANDTRRVDLVAGIGYDDDIPKAKEILEKILADHELVLSDPAPVVAMKELADSSVNFNVRPWCKTSDYWTVYADITEQIKLRFDEADVSIPFPQRDVHLHQVA